MEAIFNLLRSAGMLLAALAGRFLILLAVLTLLTAVFLIGLAVVRAVGAVRGRALGLTRIAGFGWRDGLLYAPGHTWIDLASAGAARVGLDDLAQRLLGSITALALPRPGTVLRRGEPAIEVVAGRRRAWLPSPVDGTVAAVNTRLAAHPARVNHDPYVGGWLLAVRNAVTEGSGLKGQSPARDWFGAEAVRLTHLVEHELGLTAADGGELVLPASTLVSDARWRDLASEFLGAR